MDKYSIKNNRRNNFFAKLIFLFRNVYPFILILLCFVSIVSCIVSNVDKNIIENNAIKTIITILQDNSLATLLLVLFIFEFIRDEIKQKEKNITIVSNDDFDNIVAKEFVRSDDICIILSSSRASFPTLQYIIDKNIEKKLNIKILIKKPDGNNNIRKSLVISNTMKWLELGKNNIKVEIKMYSSHEILRCYIFDNSRILAGIYSYKDTIKEKNSQHLECERHRFYGHSHMLYYTGREDSVGNFLLDKYRNQFDFMWNHSEDFHSVYTT